MLLVDEIQIESLRMSDICRPRDEYLDKKNQLDEFAAAQDSQDTQKVYVAQTAEFAYNGRNERGKSELVLGSQAQASMMDIIGMSFIPMYKVVVSPSSSSCHC